RQAPLGGDRERTIVSLLVANVTTLGGFGLLAFSRVPVLHSIGLTVALGTALALVCSAVLSRQDAQAWATPRGRRARAIPGARRRPSGCRCCCTPPPRRRSSPRPISGFGRWERFSAITCC